MASSTLATIITKVRRLTRSPSTAQLSDADIIEYVNTFIAYDFPEHLRLFKLRQTYTIYTKPFQELLTVSDVVTDPMFNFDNLFITIHNPVYIDGYQVRLTQDPNEFYSYSPQNRFDQVITTGDGVTTNFAGVLTYQPVLRNYVTFSSIDSNFNGLVLQDYPFNAEFGNLVVPNQPVPVVLDPTNNINYITGQFTATFPVAPGPLQNITAHVLPFQPSRPTVMMYYQDQFTFRPVPDAVYPVQFEVYVRPAQLMQMNDVPQLEQWWQYIAYGAAKKVFEDRSDMDSVRQIMPEYKKQEMLVIRATIVQYTNDRVQTIYCDNLNQGVGAAYNWGQGGF